MHLHANSMNILSRLQASTLGATLPPSIGGRQPQSKIGFELHLLSGTGSMAGQWDGDARLRPGWGTKRAGLAVRPEQETECVDPAVYWG